MNAEFFEALDLLEKQKGIPKEYMLERVEAALMNAFAKDQGPNAQVRIILDPEKKDVQMYRLYQVVEEVEDPETQLTVEQAKKVSRRYKLGTVAEVKMDTKNFRRLSAQTAKQVIIQGIREAERGMLIKEYEDKRGEIITATVLRTDDSTGNVTVDTGTSIATLIKGEQIPGDAFKDGERIKVFVTEVKKESRGPLVTLSRTHPGLVKRLFELEVPEVQDGTVVIKNVTREAGSRSKVAVYSTDDSVDAVGSCIGNRSMRINTIISELGGEKIDIIKYSEDPAEFIAAALSPATVNDVILEGEKICRVYVDADQLSLAIGKEGQNARLAARLTGFKIDIKVSE
ncbi:MAG: transcription termination/antitermination protein NusA [Ruminococcaceae bacterium]|nr:transcription termination/antitermination protein NusA [Oscillospiraceae bacterium]MBO5040875.1 transcription termination/antitermination protein NusA [Clostridia bacterium]